MDVFLLCANGIRIFALQKRPLIRQRCGLDYLSFPQSITISKFCHKLGVAWVHSYQWIVLQVNIENPLKKWLACGVCLTFLVETKFIPHNTSPTSRREKTSRPDDAMKSVSTRQQPRHDEAKCYVIFSIFFFQSNSNYLSQSNLVYKYVIFHPRKKTYNTFR